MHAGWARRDAARGARSYCCRRYKTFCSAGPYRYTAHLTQLERCCPLVSRPLPAALTLVRSPPSDRAKVWRGRLQAHPDREFAEYILHGLEHGFRVGFNYSHELSPAKCNMASAMEHSEVVEQYLRKECSAGRILGPLRREEVPGLHVSRIGVIPKGRASGNWRLITDLSFPEGASVNEGINPDYCTLAYTSVERVARAAHSLGSGARLAKVDIKSAYRLLPVHPQDRHLLGMEWKGAYYVDAMLPFGLRSAPKIFTAVADALEWCVRQRGVVGIDHYLDDFIIVAPPKSSICQTYLTRLEEECMALGVTLAPEKKEGPATRLVFLGIVIDTVEGCLSLPADKLSRLWQEVDRWPGRKACQRRCRRDVHMLRRMLELLKGPRHPHYFICLNQQFRADLHWWKAVAETWNGVALFPPTPVPSIEFASDASGTWGCGAWCGDKWWQWEWPQGCSKGIAFKELFAVILSAAVWGKEWRGQLVRAHCDNEAVVHMMASRSSKNPELMHLLRCLFFIEADCGFSLSVVHIAGTANILADDLSRNRLIFFLSKVPTAQQLPTPLPPPLLKVLLDTKGTWTSLDWIQQFSTTAV